jgi:sec-independent protein translocase protein TatB
MPGFGDSAFLIVLALLLFGPKKLPQLARQLGKLMADFRRASNEFRTQMEEELRISEQAERQKQIAAIEAAAPPSPTVDIPEPEHPHLPPPAPSFTSTSDTSTSESESPELIDSPSEPVKSTTEPAAAVPIATSGELSIMPPSTGLPIANSPSPSVADAAPARDTRIQDYAGTAADSTAHEAEFETETLHG